MSLSSVLTMGFQPSGDINLIVLMGYGTSGEAPPIPPPVEVTPSFYGPALTRAQRRKWYGDDEEEPQIVEARARSIEVLKKIAPEEVVEQKVEAQLAKPEVRTRPFAKPLNVEAIVAKVTKAVREEVRLEREALKKDMEEEEREAMALLAGMMMK